MPTIILIRHGETDWNIEGRYQGQADPPLNSSGMHQAQVLVTMLQDINLELLFSSPLRRAKQTAKLISEQLAIPLLEDSRLMEIHQGDWQARLRADIQALYPDLFLAWETNPWGVNPPGGENLSSVQSRVYAAVDDIIDTNPQKKIGIVSHRIPIALIKVRYQDMDPDIVRTIHLPNTYWEQIEIPLYPKRSRNP
jgi:broad specificity phosphatase PhoE